jgi:hypothetical protein
MDVKGAAAKIREILIEIEEERRIDSEEAKKLRRLKLPPWVNVAVEGVLRGYEERERALRRQDASPGVLQEYRRLNRLIDGALSAAAEDCAPKIVDKLRRDMIERRGYYGSLLSDVMSEYKFYELKRAATIYIAAKLYLI